MKKIWPFRQKESGPPTGAGLTYCAGFDLAVRADGSIQLVIEVEQLRWGGTHLHPPRKLACLQIEASPQESILEVKTDDGVLGHPCAEVFHFIVWSPGALKAEFRIAETQASSEARVIEGSGWSAEYPVLTGPNGLRIEYRPRHGYLD